MSQGKYTPKEKAKGFITESERMAEEMLKDMDAEACVELVRGFCSVISAWQTNIAAIRYKPLEFSLHCLIVAELFKLAFVKAYTDTEKRVIAEEALKKALGDTL